MAKGLALSGQQRAHLANLDAMRRLMLEVRRGRAAAPRPFDAKREAHLHELRAAGRLNADQELFLRLCGPEEVDRQHALHRFFGARYEGIVVPSLKNLADERRTQKRGVRQILRAYERDRVLARQGETPGSLGTRVLRNVASVRRFLHHFGGKRRRRPAKRPARSTAASASDGSSDPPPSDDSSEPPQKGGSRFLAARRPCSAGALGGPS